MKNTDIIEKMDTLAEKVIAVVQNVCSALLIIMLGIVFVDVFARYVFNSPIIWSEEITLMLLIWFGFFSMSNELYHGNHMSLTLAYVKFSAKTKRIVSLVNSGLMFVLFVFMAITIVRILLVISTAKMPVSGLPKALLYIPVFCSAILMCFYSIALFVKNLYKDFTKEEE